MTGDSKKYIFHKVTSAYLQATFYLGHAEFVKLTLFIPMCLLSVYFADTCMLYMMMYGWYIWYRKSGSSFDLSKEHCHAKLNVLWFYPYLSWEVYSSQAKKTNTRNFLVICINQKCYKIYSCGKIILSYTEIYAPLINLFWKKKWITKVTVKSYLTSEMSGMSVFWRKFNIIFSFQSTVWLIVIFEFSHNCPFTSCSIKISLQKVFKIRLVLCGFKGG